MKTASPWLLCSARTMLWPCYEVPLVTFRPLLSPKVSWKEGGFLAHPSRETLTSPPGQPPFLTPCPPWRCPWLLLRLLCVDIPDVFPRSKRWLSEPRCPLSPPDSYVSWPRAAQGRGQPCCAGKGRAFLACSLLWVTSLQGCWALLAVWMATSS